jgi:hypothetical protein
MAGFTPGPWKLHWLHGHVSVQGQCGHEQIISAVGHSCGNSTYDEETANAALIAAAPDLLQMCKILVERLRLVHQASEVAQKLVDFHDDAEVKEWLDDVDQDAVLRVADMLEEWKERCEMGTKGERSW